MESRQLACIAASAVVGTLLTLAFASSAQGRKPEEAVVIGQRIDPATQRLVSYRDLNLVYAFDQKALKTRIRDTAADLCTDLVGMYDNVECYHAAVKSTDGQVAAAIDRAMRQQAGLPVGPAIAISMVIPSAQ